ncbi:MAG: hypothetical protein AAB425_11350 [Bdellovibrionota bacterium]
MKKVLWGSVFSAWLVLISGYFSHSLHAPGFKQAIELTKLNRAKLTQLVGLELEVEALERDSALLEMNPVALEQEVRRVLGYVASDEIVLEFPDVKNKILKRVQP